MNERRITEKSAGTSAGTPTAGARGSAPRCAHRLLVELELPHPFWRYAELFAQDGYRFLLDSAMDPDKLGRYSFLGGEPTLVFSARRRRDGSGVASADITLKRLRDDDGSLLAQPRETRTTSDPLVALRAALADFRPATDPPPDCPAPFLGGAVGFFGYETGYCCEALPDRGIDDLQLPDMRFLLVDTVLAHCHRTGRCWLAVTGRGPDEHAAQTNAMRTLDRWRHRVDTFHGEPDDTDDKDGHTSGPAVDDLPGAPVAVDTSTVNTHFDRAAYCRAVERIREHIRAGDVFEACLTHRLDAPLRGRPWDLYRQLRRINPAPFAAYLEFPDFKIVSASPERFLRLDADGVAESRPIKGTRPRGATPEADAGLRHELATSEKDRAENLMIVDLVRNDLGRVAKIGTVTVPELQIIEPYATVFQLVSTIRAELAAGHDGLDLVRACFPGGSMTGAPKIEAMKIIDSIEPVKRGVYAGAIGYFDHSGALDLSIVIRTIVCTDGRAYCGVGGAVVHDSDPAAEYEETLHKARALLAALERQNQAARRKTRAAAQQ